MMTHYLNGEGSMSERRADMMGQRQEGGDHHQYATTSRTWGAGVAIYENERDSKVQDCGRPAQRSKAAVCAGV